MAVVNRAHTNPLLPPNPLWRSNLRPFIGTYQLFEIKPDQIYRTEEKKSREYQIRGHRGPTKTDFRDWE